MKNWNQNDVNFIKSCLEKLPCFGENFDTILDNHKSELERSIVFAYNKMKALFSPIY